MLCLNQCFQFSNVSLSSLDWWTGTSKIRFDFFDGILYQDHFFFVFIFSTFFSFQFQILLSMSNCRSFLGFLTIILFVVWIFKIDKLQLEFSSGVNLLNHFGLGLRYLFNSYLFLRSNRFDLNFFLRLNWLNWLLCLNWLNCLNLLSNICSLLNSLLNWLGFSDLFNNYLISWWSLSLWLDSHNLHLTWCFCIWFLNRFYNFNLFLLYISGRRCYWLFFNNLDLLSRLSNRLNSWLYNWFCDWFHNRLNWRFHLLLNSLSNWLRSSLNWLCRSQSWLGRSLSRLWSCICCLGALLNLVLELIQLLWGKTCSNIICLLWFLSIRLSSFDEIQSFLKSCLYLFLVRWRVLRLCCQYLGVLNHWLLIYWSK